MTLALEAQESTQVAVGDLYAEALADGGAAGALQVEKEASGLHPTSLFWWLRHPGAAEPVDFAALALVQDGPVFDVGCATGRHLEWLTGAGIEAEGIDVNPRAVELARLRGSEVKCIDVWQFRPSRRYRWVLALGNNVGIAGRVANLTALLERFAALLLPDGEILLSSVVPEGGDATRAGRPAAHPGEMRLRHHYAGRVGDWFDWLYVDPSTLARHARRAGLQTRVIERIGSTYLAVLGRQQSVHAAQL